MNKLNFCTILMLTASDPEQDTLAYEWELLPEPAEFGAYAGQGEVKPEAVQDFILEAEGGKVRFRVPEKGGMSYRMFVYVEDGNGKLAVANFPFHVNGSSLQKQKSGL